MAKGMSYENVVLLAAYVSQFKENARRIKTPDMGKYFIIWMPNVSTDYFSKYISDKYWPLFSSIKVLSETPDHWTGEPSDIKQILYPFQRPTSVIWGKKRTFYDNIEEA